MLPGAGPRVLDGLVSRIGWRVLLLALGAAELLMAAEAPVVLRVVGAVGALALVLAAVVARSTRTLVALVGLGVVPFGALGWTALVPLVLVLAATVVSIPLVRQLRRAPVPQL